MHNINKEIQILPDKQGCADYYIKIFVYQSVYKGPPN